MFTETQLSTIRHAAKVRKNQGELAVLYYLRDFNHNSAPDYFFSDNQMDILHYIAEECKRQRSGEMSVYDMANAWDYALKDEDFLLEENTLHLTKAFIKRIGSIVEPHENKNGFRTLWVQVGSDVKENPEFIDKDLDTLLYLYYEGVLKEYPNLGFGSPNFPLWDTEKKQELTDIDYFYYYYETIHPFFDGNGRSGKIIYNYLKGTLDNPVLPPNFWGGNP